jgi:serine/threonine protein kinase
LPENVESIVDRLFLFEEMVKSLKTIHSELIVHRDLKPDNIFFGADMGVRIVDFGDACIGRDEFGACGGTPNLGTKNYSAPELGTAQKITEKVCPLISLPFFACT